MERLLGPGRRAVVWVQGCSRRCPGCVAPEMQPHNGGEAVDPEALARKILAAHPDGITVSGGEPAEQAAAVAALLAPLRAAGLNVILYSGWQRGELAADCLPGSAALLALTDWLIDGDYRQELDDGRPLAGSSNQTVHRLTPAGERMEAPEQREWQLELDGDGNLALTGLPPPGFVTNFRRRLAQSGLRLPDWK